MLLASNGLFSFNLELARVSNVSNLPLEGDRDRLGGAVFQAPDKTSSVALSPLGSRVVQIYRKNTQ